VCDHGFTGHGSIHLNHCEELDIIWDIVFVVDASVVSRKGVEITVL
jgi:hypothetical protein